jgi:hypothetical protein
VVAQKLTDYKSSLKNEVLKKAAGLQTNWPNQFD